MRDKFLTMINHLLEATLDHFKSQAQFKIDRNRGTAECRSSVWVPCADKTVLKQNTEIMRSKQLASAKSN